jgi:SAM-dependent methyltransferase
MVMKLDAVVPFGRSLDEYIRMFSLTPADLGQRILGIGDGPASFNAEGTQRGMQVTSVDPVYEFSSTEIQRRFEAVVDSIIGQIRATPNNWVWGYHKSPDDLRRNREQALAKFLADYGPGKDCDRYQVGELPKLNFPDQAFDLALCSHFLFLYSEHCDYDFHRQSIRELLRVSREVRIFPLLTLAQARSPYLAPLLRELQQEGQIASIVQVDYELQPGGHEMLVISASAP